MLYSAHLPFLIARENTRINAPTKKKNSGIPTAVKLFNTSATGENPCPAPPVSTRCANPLENFTPGETTRSGRKERGRVLTSPCKYVSPGKTCSGFFMKYSKDP